MLLGFLPDFRNFSINSSGYFYFSPWITPGVPPKIPPETPPKVYPVILTIISVGIRPVISTGMTPDISPECHKILFMRLLNILPRILLGIPTSTSPGNPHEITSYNLDFPYYRRFQL